MINLIKNEVSCNRTLELIRKALTVGYVDSKTKQTLKSKVGTPQGSVLSPLLANIVLHQLDVFITEKLSPEFHRGKRRRTNPEYNALINTRYGKKKGVTQEEKKDALLKMRTLPRMDVNDPGFRRSMFIRYADDFVYLFEGPYSETLVIKSKIKEFLKEIGLELNDEKTIISHINEGFHFLGAFIRGLGHHDFRMINKTTKGKCITMRASVRAKVNMPTKIMLEKLIKNKLARRNHFGEILASPVTSLVNLDHATIVQFFNSKIHGILNYFSFAGNRVKISNLI